MSQFEGRVAFITGAARGQGRRHAELLADRGCNLVLVDVCEDADVVPYALSTEAQLHETSTAVATRGVRCLPLKADVRSSAQTKQAVAQTLAEFGHIDFLVANAGVLTMATIVDSTDEEWQICLDVNLTGAYNCIKAVLPSMLERRRGRIVATASLAARGGVNQGLGYVASKWGLIGLIKTVAIECGPYGITANAVCPTNCNTPMFRNDAINHFFRPDLENPQFSDIEDIARSMHPLGVPFIEPEDVSHALLFLLSDEARYVSGEALHISAGQIATNTA